MQRVGGNSDSRPSRFGDRSYKPSLHNCAELTDAEYKQMETLNSWLHRNEYSFWLWLFLSILTCGIFGIYYEYKMANGINEIQENNGWRVADSLAVICVLLALFGVGIASLAIQQFEIHKFYGEHSDM